MNYLTPIPLTSNHLQNCVLYVLACVGTVLRSTLLPLASSYKYLAKELQTMRRLGLITITNTRPGVISLAATGRDLMQSRAPAIYAYYMAITNNGHPGGTEHHKRLREQAATAAVTMLCSGIQLGPCKPPVQDVRAGLAPPYTLSPSQYFPWRELVPPDAKEAREHVSRSTGVLITPTTRAVVYSLPRGQEFLLADRAEYVAHHRLVLHMRQLYAATDLSQQTARSIIVGTPEDMLSALTPSKKGGKKSLYYALQEHSYAGAHLHFVAAPGTSPELQLLAESSPIEIMHRAFTPGEIAAASTSVAEACIKGLDCYEFLTGDLSKLMWIKRAYPDTSRIGLVCWPAQKDFLHKLFGTQIKLRVKGTGTQK
jgi:hypothetical protein